MSSYRAGSHDDAARKRALDVWEQRVQAVTANTPKDRTTPAKVTQKKQKTG